MDTLEIVVADSTALPRDARAELVDFLRTVYDEELDAYLTHAGPGRHWFGRLGGALVSHAMYVTRWLQAEGRPPWCTAYVEVVGTLPGFEGRGFASRLLRALAADLPTARGATGEPFAIAALAPADIGFYERLGWELWRGPLAVRQPDGVHRTPDERAMVLRLPRTPSELDLDAPLSIEWRPGEVW